MELVPASLPESTCPSEFAEVDRCLSGYDLECRIACSQRRIDVDRAGRGAVGRARGHHIPVRDPRRGRRFHRSHRGDRSRALPMLPATARGAAPSPARSRGGGRDGHVALCRRSRGRPGRTSRDQCQQNPRHVEHAPGHGEFFGSDRNALANTQPPPSRSLDRPGGRSAAAAAGGRPRGAAVSGPFQSVHLVHFSFCRVGHRVTAGSWPLWRDE